MILRVGVYVRAGLLLGSALGAATAGTTRVEVRLLTPVSTYRSRAGTPIAGLVATPLCTASGEALPTGTVVQGTLRRVHKVGLGLVRERALLAFDFGELRLPDGRAYPVETRLLDVDNARESVDRKGTVHGIRVNATIANRIGERIAFAVMDHPVAMIPLFAFESGVFRFPDPEIQYGSGTELDMELRFPESLGAVMGCDAEPRAASAGLTAGWRQLLAGLPAWSYSQTQPQPMDRVNLVFVGGQVELETAFAAAGWGGAENNSVRAGVNAIRAIAERQRFADAPMRTLLLDGAGPDFSYQKTLDTFEKRHHLRIWRWPTETSDTPVWASAATRDVAATFAMRPFGFTHQVQFDIDRERDKVVRDLQFTGCVGSVDYVARPAGSQAPAENRKGVVTDGLVAVVTLNSCQEPTLAPLPELPMAVPLLVRIVRRVVLTGRNHALRDNIVWRSADAGRLGFVTLRGWIRERRNQRRALLALAAAK